MGSIQAKNNKRFINCFLDINIEYFFITECAHLISYIGKTNKIQTKLVQPAINFFKKRIKTHNASDYDYLRFYYCKFSKDSHPKINKLVKTT